jgi:preprotein translocase subunit SecA
MADLNDMRRFEAYAQQAAERRQVIEQLSDHQLSSQTTAFRQRLADGEGLADVLPEVLASAREATRRTVGTVLTDAQLMAGASVQAGLVAEMGDGEGKTLASVLAAYLHALIVQNVHLATLDDSLARWSGGQAAAVLSLLGLQVGMISAGSSPAERKLAYAADVTCGAYEQFGYDYLRDNLVWDPVERVQHGLQALVLDEIDTVLIDQAANVLMLQGGSEPDADAERGPAQDSSGGHDDAEKPIVARISVPGYFRLYRAGSGLTATARAAGAEFRQSFGLEVTRVPANAPTRRIDHDDLMYPTRQAKLNGLIQDVQLRHDAGQPIVIAGPDEAGEQTSRWLDEAGIAHAILPASDPDDTASLMADAGRLGSVTVICGTAGRGYSIPLGGASAQEREKVIAAGGLAVLGSERNTSLRADDWLRSLAGRHQEPGESRFLVAMDDPFMTGPARSRRLGAVWRRRSPGPGIPLTGPMRQAVAEHLWAAENRQARERRLKDEYEDVTDSQCSRTYEMRQAALDGGDLLRHAGPWFDAAIETAVAASRDNLHLSSALAALYPIGLSADDLLLEGSERRSDAEVVGRVKADIRAAYKRREEAVGAVLLHELGAKLFLGVIDKQWRRHLADLDQLRAIAVAHDSAAGDPLESYRQSAAERYDDFLRRVETEFVSKLFFLEVTF